MVKISDAASGEAERQKKKELSEAKRLASFGAKRELEKQRQAAISERLKDLDSSTSKKIVFGSESEDSENEEPNPVQSKRMRLFDANDDDVEGSSLLVENSIVNRHFGKKGAKLAMMEARFGHDSRFKMDEKFVESDGEESEQEEEAKEKEASLAILSKVLGKTVKPKATMKKTAAMFRRFDPENEQHVQWLESRTKKAAVDSPKAEEEGSDKAEDSLEGNEPEKRVVEGRFFEMDTSFAETLKKKLKNEQTTEADAGFSFLKSIGRSSSPATEKEKAAETLTNGTAASSEKVIVKADPKDNDLGLHTEIKKDLEPRDLKSQVMVKSDPDAAKLLQSKELATIDSSAPASWIFFLNEHDTTVQNVVNNFHRNVPLEVIRKKWTSVRESIVKVYKAQRKKALKAMKNEINGSANASTKGGLRKRKNDEAVKLQNDSKSSEANEQPKVKNMERKRKLEVPDVEV